jgi:hypothetical protein
VQAYKTVMSGKESKWKKLERKVIPEDLRQEKRNNMQTR